MYRKVDLGKSVKILHLSIPKGTMLTLFRTRPCFDVCHNLHRDVFCRVDPICTERVLTCPNFLLLCNPDSCYKALTSCICKQYVLFTLFVSNKCPKCGFDPQFMWNIKVFEMLCAMKAATQQVGHAVVTLCRRMCYAEKG